MAKSETQNQRLELMALTRPNKTRRLAGVCPALAHQEAVGWVDGRVWNLTDRFWRSKPSLLAGHSDLLQTLLPPSRLRLDMNCSSEHSSEADYRCPKCFQVHYPHHFQLDGSLFFLLSTCLILEFVLQGGPLQTKLVAKVIFPKI